MYDHRVTSRLIIKISYHTYIWFFNSNIDYESWSCSTVVCIFSLSIFITFAIVFLIIDNDYIAYLNTRLNKMRENGKAEHETYFADLKNRYGKIWKKKIEDEPIIMCNMIDINKKPSLKIEQKPIIVFNKMKKTSSMIMQEEEEKQEKKDKMYITEKKTLNDMSKKSSLKKTLKKVLKKASISLYSIVKSS